MNKNLIPEIIKMLGVELGEEFKIDTSGDDIFQITESGVWMRKGIDKEKWVEKPFEFVMLCNGDAKLIKLPWRPKKGEGYWTFNVFFGSGKWAVASFAWGDEVFDKAVLKAGWVYRTKEEAEAALPKVAAEMGVEYELQEALNELWR